jgi:hypothetical protein
LRSHPFLVVGTVLVAAVAIFPFSCEGTLEAGDEDIITVEEVIVDVPGVQKLNFIYRILSRFCLISTFHPTQLIHLKITRMKLFKR